MTRCVGFAVAALLLGQAVAGGALAGTACRDDRVLLRGPAGKAAFTVEIADDEAERAQGLMFRDSLPASRGMLFVYESEHPVSFWMRNTLIPLDMVFLDSAGRVVAVHADARPGDETPIPSGVPVRMVLEIAGGLAARLGIAPGTVMRHPRLDQAIAAWPCGAPD